MLKQLAALLGLSLATSAAAQVSPADYRYRSVSHSHITGVEHAAPASESDQTTYVQGSRIRREFRGFVGESPQDPKATPPRMATISDCARRRAYTLDLDAREYTADRFPAYPTEKQIEPLAAQSQQATRVPAFQVDISFQDSGEQREFFGYQARKFIIVDKRTPLTDDSHPPTSATRTEAWYVEGLDLRATCMPSHGHGVGFAILYSPDNHAARPEIHVQGHPPTGFLVKSVTTGTDQMPTANGHLQPIRTEAGYEVVEFSTAPLDPALFEVPEGFKKVKHLYRH